MEVIAAIIFTVSTLFGGTQTTTTDSGATISQGSSVIVVHDTTEMN
ncbi:MAG TPA: hypothetical protein VFO76_03600 [Candidatus Kapabacteria bacterium]|nr:hypothetical protein [Candidatus Kapabacteria bacterium]